MTSILKRALAFIVSMRESMMKRVVALPVHMDADGQAWWLDVSTIEENPKLYGDIPFYVIDIKFMPDEVKERLVVLFHLDDGQKLHNVGKKLDKRHYLVYIEDRHYKRAAQNN